MNDNPLHTAYLSLGSNLGDREQTLREAILRLDRHPDIRVTQISSVYETAPVGMIAQPDFLNLALEIKTSLDAKKLLEITSSTELDMGRQRDMKWGPRTLDIDILLMDKQVMDTAELILPHPRMGERAFVLLPLAEIAGAKVHPVTQQTVSDMANQVDGKEGVFLCQIRLASVCEPSES
ncbi:2-amino-4-hydroxy-6-hydroxymethyldihydropteridine diphosphokinase [Tumebacillus algifaecis]|uniref:2-amino-4-hydroxy-6-hydroxymethyldihydropteridine diphosphokinase n=1 Tax=Tumebacillus algifaecis TaxID=1214604 RepID=A0A223D5W1_9BACL|nr:2-amino-4-hydroxy-6-hydroxymethyldihydropteridine diphosphokinase [Tumebacillus algifaecis]ASS76972.1 2-amino-4-hydroxy-6-hydroxymethyldihydropteridine diphosphokinase [Tumebacillus algifaecis]